MGPGRAEVRQLLKDELEQANAAYAAANHAFHEMIDTFPSNIPQPDGTLRVEQAGRAVQAAQHLYLTALENYTKFIVADSIPENLKDK
jgi:hypothetical protein